MNIDVEWDNREQTIIRILFRRGWQWAELEEAIRQADTYITSVPHTVHLLIDIQEAGGVPADVITRAGNLFEQGEARTNEGQKVIVGAGMLIQAAYRAFLKVYGTQMAGRPFQFADSPEAARQMLRQM
ncbi:MAG: hypothetical protein J0L63_14715 [Anaerolineae bacterium]|nr:hypothetical protein [Anaerolineae bacterium]